MELAGYIVSSVIVSLGILLGVFLGWLAKEELKPGRKYLLLFQVCLVALMLFFSIYFMLSPHVLIMLAFILLVWLQGYGISKEPKDGFYCVVYAVFAFLFFDASCGSEFILFDSLIFLFSFPLGSLMFKRKSWAKQALSFSSLFVAISIILFILLEFLKTP